jgi:3-oxoacyl-[acyl-carrier protein] reductase
MIRQKFIRITHISPIASQQCEFEDGSHDVSNTAFSGYSKILSKENSRFEILLNILSLNYFENGFIKKLNEKFRKETLKKIPTRRFGKAEYILFTIKFLRKCECINNDIINLHGGL